MTLSQSKTYYGTLGLSVAFSVLAILTLVPSPVASKPNVLGCRLHAISRR